MQTGYDTVLNAISSVLSRTIFSVRPYSAKFKGLRVSETAYGNHVRKLSIADRPAVDDDRYKWPVGHDTSENPANGDGESVDQYTIRKPQILQTNFYGSSVYSDYVTIFRDQLEQAFKGPDELGEFVSMVMTNMTDKLENERENLSRALVANLIAGIIDENAPDRVVHLLTEYNTLTGLTLTATTVYKPENFPGFMKWAYSRIASISSMMTERSQMYQTIVNSMPVMRHTPVADQRVYLYAPAMYQSTAMVLADTYHDNFLRLADTETVNFWQSIKDPAKISCKPARIGSTGAVVVPAQAVTKDKVFGVICDKEAMGYAETQQWSAPTPFNARGGYSNNWYHTTFRTWSDASEKAVVLLLD